MRRNNKFYKRKKLLKARREWSEAYDEMRNNRTVFRGWKRNLVVKKTARGKGWYRDLKQLLGLIGRTEFSQDKKKWGQALGTGFLLRGLLRKLRIREFEELPSRLQRFFIKGRGLILGEVRPLYSSEFRELDPYYYQYLEPVVKKHYVPVYLSYQMPQTKRYGEINNRMSRDNLWTKSSRAAYKRVKHKYEENEMVQHKRRKQKKKDMIEEVDEWKSSES